MRRYLVAAAIVLFWLNSMRMLVGREVIPAVREAAEAAQGVRYTDVRKALTGNEHTVMGIYVSPKPGNGKDLRRVGTLIRDVQPRGDDALLSETLIDLDLGAFLGSRDPFDPLMMKTHFEVRVDRGKLSSIDLDVCLQGDPAPLIIASGRPVGDKLSVVVRLPKSSHPGAGLLRTVAGLFVGKDAPAQSAGVLGSDENEVHKTLLFNPDYLLDSGGSPVSGLPDLYLDKQWTVRTINPFTLNVDHVQARVVRRETINWLDEEQVECYVIEIGQGAFKCVAWVDDLRRVLQYKAAGFTFILEREALLPPAPAGPRNGGTAPDSDRGGDSGAGAPPAGPAGSPSH